MFVYLRLVPFRIRTVGSFRAPDPWNGQRETDFNLEAYRMIAKGARRPSAMGGGKELYGIRSEIDGAERMLPDSLSVLCLEGRVPKEALPRLLFEVTPTLRKRDYDPIWGTTIHFWIGGFFGLIAAACVSMAGFQLAASNAARGHETVRTTLAEWLARPQKEGENIVTERGATLEGALDVDFTPVAAPPLLQYPGDGHYRIGWFDAQGGQRLVLMTARDSMTGMPNVTGVTLRPEAIGMPESTLAELRARAPRADTRFVTCQFWTWQDAYAGSSLGFVFWTALAAISAIGGGIPVLVLVARKARRRRQMRHLMSRL